MNSQQTEEVDFDDDWGDQTFEVWRPEPITRFDRLFPRRVNQRYKAYAWAHGHTVDEQRRADRGRFPWSLYFAPSTRWIAARWNEWKRERGYPDDDWCPSPEHHADFTLWLFGLPL